MKTWRVAAGSRIEGLAMGEETPARPGPTQVRVRVHATALNYRDLMIVNGRYPVSTQEPLVPEWAAEVRKLAGGEGVDLVLEVGGEKTVTQSLAAVRMQGTVTVIGGVSGPGGAVAPRQIKPVIDRVIAATEVPEAYRHFEAGKHFGKVALSFA